MHLQPRTLLSLLLAIPLAVHAFEGDHRPHPHRRFNLDLNRRAGAPALNDSQTATDSVSVILGHQVTSSTQSNPTQIADPDAGKVTTSTTTSVSSTSTTAQQQQQQSSSLAPSSVSASQAVGSNVASNGVVGAVTSTQSSTSSSSTTVAASSSSTSAVAVTTSTSTYVPQVSVIHSTTTAAGSSAATSVPSVIRSTVHSSSASATASSAASGSGTSTSKLSKTALIAIIVVASVLVGALAIWTIIRKWKLGPSRKFDERMQPLDFSPASGDMSDPFFEKTRRRYSRGSGASISAADHQRRQMVQELDAAEHEKYAYEMGHHSPPVVGGGYLQGVPSHDFTAGATGNGVANSQYPYDPYGYPPQPSGHAYPSHGDESLNGNEYADLRRGPSTIAQNFAGMGAGAGGLQATTAPAAAMAGYDQEERLYDHDGQPQPQSSNLTREPSLGRPTRGDGPYFAATQFGQGGARY